MVPTIHPCEHGKRTMYRGVITPRIASTPLGFPAYLVHLLAQPLPERNLRRVR